MKHTENYSYKQPERTAANNDPADINDLADNWGALDRDLKALEDAQATTQTGLAAHTTNRLNPHGVTAEQVDTYPKAEIDARMAGYESHIKDEGNPHNTTADQVGSYTIAETEERLDTRVTRGGDLAGNMVLVTSQEGEAVTALILADELEALAGVSGNIQEQLNNISFYNYLPSLPIVTLGIGGDSFPQQAETDLQVIPLLYAAYPNPAYRDAVIQNVQTQNLTQRKAVLYCYFDGTQNDGYIGWRYVTDIDTVINRANGDVYGVVKDSDDISWLAGEGTVHHAEDANLAEIATKLQTARSLQTNLASTSAASFDGSANAFPGVTGTLPVANGGTGNTTGLAASATKLATARSFSISGGATAAAKSFNGEANVALEVTALDVSKATAGTLPVARGGTGNTTGTAANSTQLNGQAASYYATAASVTSLTSTVGNKANTADVLTKANTTAYTPTASYHPATKAYVDANTGGNAPSADTAAKLQTARTIQTNLASTTGAAFDGTTNITPGVTGTLPIANGGTGNTTGLAPSATKLATARNLSITGGATAAAKAFNGEANVALEVTALDVSKATAGTLPVARGGTGNTTGTAANSTQLNGQAASYYATASSVTSLTSTVNNKANTADVLTKTNTTAFTPTASYHPATKAYVDGKSVDNANTATKLQTARTIQTNLGTTTAASFDGSANITPGITGTLPVANGGTGNTTGKAADSAKLNGQAASYYATATAASAAQTTANAAMPKTGGTFTGNIGLSRTTQAETTLTLTNSTGSGSVRVSNSNMCYRLSTTSGTHYFQLSNGNGARVSCSVVSTGSSKRYKKNIAPVDKKHIEALKQANVCQFIRKNDETEAVEIGVIAESMAELDEIFVQRDADGNPDTVSLNNIIFTNLAITQELLKAVTALQAKLDAFENRLPSQPSIDSISPNGGVA